MSKLAQSHGNNKGASNLLIALLLAESKKVNTTDFSDFDPFDTTINLEPTQHGLLKKEIQFFIQEEFVTELDLSAGVVEQFDRTVRDYLLVEQGLLKVRHHRKKRAHTHDIHSPSWEHSSLSNCFAFERVRWGIESTKLGKQRELGTDVSNLWR